MKTCACISLSGGQGKTTTIFFLALLLGRRGKRVLVVDADPQANQTFFLNHEVKETEPSLLEVLQGDVKAEEGVYETQYENVYLIPADRGLFKVGEYLSQSGSGAYILKLRLKELREWFDYVLIDVQPSRSQLSLTAAGACDRVLIPVEANIKGVNSLLETLEFIEEQQELEAFRGEVLGVVPFRDRWVGNQQTKEGKQTIEAMVEIAGEKKVLGAVRESEQFKRALRQGCLLEDLGYRNLQEPFERIVEELENE